MADLLSFAIGLESSTLVSGAEKGKSSVDKLSTSLGEAKTKLASYQGQLSLATKLGDAEGIAKYTPMVEASRRSVFNLTQQLEKAGPAAASAGGGMAALAGPLGVAATAGAVVTGVFWGIVDVTTSLVSKAFEVTEANEKLAATFEALGDTRSGKNTLDLVKQLAKELPQSKAQIVEWTKGLQAAGVTDLGELRAQIKATASAQAIMGDSGAQAYEKLREKVAVAAESHTPLKIASKGLTTLYHAGLNVEDIAGRMGMSTNALATGLKAGTINATAFGDAMRDSLLTKGKRSLDAANNSIDVLIGKAKGAWKGVWGSLFTDVDTKPIIYALQSVAALGGDTAKTAGIFKTGFTGALNAVIKLIGAAIVEAEVFFLDIEIWALSAYIAMKPLIRGFERVAELAGKVSEFVSPSGAEAGAAAGAGASGAAPSGLERAGGALSAANAAAVGNFFGGGVLGGAAGLTVGTYELIKTMGDDAARAIARESGLALGKETIAGIKEGTETHSPSKAAIRIGASLGQGMGIGMVNSPEPARAARTVSGNALAGLGRVAAAGGAGGMFGSGGFHVDHLEVNIQAPDGVTDATELSAIGLAVSFERLQLASGR